MKQTKMEYHSNETPPNILITTKKRIEFRKEEYKKASDKYNTLLNDPKTYSIYMDIEDNNWVINYDVYTDAWLKKYGRT